MLRLAPFLVLLICGSALAGPVEDLADLTRRSLSSTNPGRTFYVGLAGFGDVSLGRDDVARALDLAQVPTDGMWARAVTSIVGLEKEGDEVRIRRDEDILMTTDNGTMKLAKTIRFKLEVVGEDALLSDMKGVSVGVTTAARHRVKTSLYSEENGVPIVEAKVGIWPFNKTVKIAMPPEKLEGLTGAIP
jgi:hypothetical protein